MMSKITVATSCGKEFKMQVADLDDRQLRGLIRENADRPGINPADIAALRKELVRREPLALT